MSRVNSVNIATTPSTGDWTGRIGASGIDKRPVEGPVSVTASGVAADTVCDTDNHGRWFQAVYAHDVEDLRYWSGETGRELPPGSTGENLTLLDCDCSNAVIGERWRIGTAVLRVTGPRTPCRVFAGFWEFPGLIKRFTEHGRPGTYFAVEYPGELSPGDSREVLSRPEHGVTVAELFAFRMGRATPELADHVAAAEPDLPGEWAAKVR
ncbi:MOSC domain-containing protein [Actinopolyspora erythraea]|uniref:MOSC domain-containing protein n=1 Tax=Actinopolyspora erythraea TaxID=414996 RepID=UPI001C113377|nr:MOSC domain-containing protein [Actinopolyspora erythraea]